MIRSANQRALVACSSLAVCFTVFSFRLVDLQVTKQKGYAIKAASQNSHKEPIFAMRGSIVDVHGLSLAQNEPVKTVVADATLIKDQAALAILLAGPLQMEVTDLREKLGRTVEYKHRKGPQPAPYVILKKDVPEETAIEIARIVAEARTAKIVYTSAAIRFEQDYVRVYPNRSMLCHVLGYVGDEGRGVDGVEASLNQMLDGQNGYRCVERDRTGRELVPYRGDEKAPRNGSTVRLTIDLGLQQIVETEIDAAVRLFKPKKATVIMMNPKTGEIMALANRPNFDPNPRRHTDEKQAKAGSRKATPAADSDLENRKNIAVADQVEPGSTFKIVAAAAALNERVVNPGTEIFCENSYWAWCKLRDHRGYGALTVENVLVKSSNIGIAKIAIQLGDQKFYEYVRKFGFGEKTSVDLPGEIRGKVLPPYAWDKLTITRMPMGQSIAATPLQIVAAMSTIANGGTLMMPQIISGVSNGEGRTDYAPREVRTVVSKRAAGEVRDALVQVVGPRGTAPLAQVAGFKVAGKTGTAQKRDASGHMSHEDYVVSFVGFLPADDPAFVMLVLLDEAQTKHSENYGGLVAAPVFSRIAEKAARYLNLQPTEVNMPASGIFTKSGGMGAPRD